MPVCQIQLGMQNRELPNSALSASSQLNAYAGPENARLHFCAESGRYGAWIAQNNYHSQYYQVDFGVETQVTRIETQGRQDSLQYVKEYTLRYSIDGSYFKQYQPSGFTKVRCFLKLTPNMFFFRYFRQSGIVPSRYIGAPFRSFLLDNVQNYKCLLYII